jgi:adenosylhomocysteine nucleosidase
MLGPKIVIIAAMEREVRSLVRTWPGVEREHDGVKFKFYEGPLAVLVCGGIGSERARRATEAAIALYQPPLVISAGFAGALDAQLAAGTTIFPAIVIDAQDGSRRETVVGDTKVGQTELGRGVLVSFGSVAGAEQKARLAKSFGAIAVDMEAAAVARGAEARGIAFMAAKTISDEVDMQLPPLDRFVRDDGGFSTFRFVIFVLPMFWLWPRVVRLARNSRRATNSLCAWLGNDALWTLATLRAFARQES